MANKHKKKKRTTNVQPDKHRDNNILHSKVAKVVLLIMALAFVSSPIVTLIVWFINLNK